MQKLILAKIKESAFSILPITAIVFILSFTPIFDMSNGEKIVFLISSMALIVAMGLFNLGANMAMTTMGEQSGVGLLKMQKPFLLLLTTFVMGFLVTIAEPDLMVLAEQTSMVIDSSIMVVSVGIGVATFLLIAILKMVFHKPLSQILMVCYMLLFALVALLYENGRDSFAPVAFDSGGVTTGPITVPFIMSFGYGIATTLGGRDSNENSFGMVSLSSVGPILVVVLLSIISKGSMNYVTEIYSIDNLLKEGILFKVIIEYLFKNCIEVGRAIGLILLFFLVLQCLVLKLPKTKIIQILMGIVVTFVGLTTFLTSVAIGFFPIGQSIGFQLAKIDKIYIIIFGFIVGMTVVLAEPAVQVLNEQVEEVTGGSVTRKSMMIALSIGVGLSVALSFIRIVCGFSLLYYLVPGYFLSLLLSLFVPPIYTSIAFDSGGVASGPMASTFILPLVIGFCTVYLGDSAVLEFGFGVVALIAMTPLITIQLLGFSAVASKVVSTKINMSRILTANDDQIVYFDI